MLDYVKNDLKEALETLLPGLTIHYIGLYTKNNTGFIDYIDCSYNGVNKIIDFNTEVDSINSVIDKIKNKF